MDASIAVDKRNSIDRHNFSVRETGLQNRYGLPVHRIVENGQQHSAVSNIEICIACGEPSLLFLKPERLRQRLRELADARGRELHELPHATFVPFTAQTRMSGVDIPAGHGAKERMIRKGSADAIKNFIAEDRPRPGLCRAIRPRSSGDGQAQPSAHCGGA